ncbi:kinase-like domain-containing protein [Halteromyces radiatus]|uniref:kinase-like domain-containing protein n=1 Tax=Halteromyces radiatus TaxID=101107 RepID=UPI00221EDAE5|nr:kinase-like domain-containing protein [Halteromyces radiatus]KAI8089789.1 kinase-like domain-containing protein [Halteromyces radiatus]
MSNEGQKTSAIRSGHEIDIATLETFLVERIPNFSRPLHVSQFAFGQSNPTYLLKDGNQQQYVLRKKPPGALLSKTAHAIEREYRIINALGQHSDVPVPKVYALCEDASVIGTPFYVMEFLKGRIFEDVRMLSLPYEDRRQCWYSALETLAKLHRVDFKAIGLETYGRNSGFYERQMKSLHKVSSAQAAVVDKDTGIKVHDLPRLDEMFAWFKKNQPKDIATIVHGDFKIDNLVYHPIENRVIGVLDWELSTIGHPLSDLANLLQPFYIPASDSGFKDMKGPLPIPDSQELMQVYCRYSQQPFPIPQWMFAVAFSHFRLAVITQGIAARVARKQASSARAIEVAGKSIPMANLTLEIVDQGDLVNDNSSKL